MANSKQYKIKMPAQHPRIRNKNFDEVTLGYTKEMALEEASRCLSCKDRPCVSKCPVNVGIPDFIKAVTEEDFLKAYEIITSTNALPRICGRVCPQESQCESTCIRGIKGESVAIGRLERFVSDWHSENADDKNRDRMPKDSKKVAVIGSGPAGLACAGDLAKFGYNVTVFEALHEPGGVLVYGIPEFRLPKSIVKSEIKKLKNIGVNFETNMVIGKSLSIDELFEAGFKAIFVGSGAGLPKFMNIDGEGLQGVFSANEFLTRINLMKAYQSDYDTPILNIKSCAVIGGGNVAMDVARCAKRLGSEKVYIIYRRSIEEMPARFEEICHAQDEDIEFKLLSAPVKIIADETGRVSQIECIQMELTSPDETGRRTPKIKENSNFLLDVDSVVVAIGSSPNPLIVDTTDGMESTAKGCIKTDFALETTREGIFAGGDAVTGAATVILAMGAGKTAAKSIDEYLKSK